MKSIIKLICVSSIALGLSACSFTQGVAQAAYDNKADSDCGKQHHQADTIHGQANSLCRHGRYDSSLNPNSKDQNKKDWDKDEVFKPSLESDY